MGIDIEIDYLILIGLSIVLLLIANITKSNMRRDRHIYTDRYEHEQIKDQLNDMQQDIRHIKDVVNNNTGNLLSNIVHKLQLNPMLSCDSGIIRYFQTKLRDVMTQYETIRDTLIHNPTINILDKLTSKEYINMFVGGGSSELRLYYSYKCEEGNICYYPDKFLSEVDNINFKSYDKFLTYFRDILMYRKDQVYALKHSVIKAFEDDVISIYNLYLLHKTSIKDPQLKLITNNIDIISSDTMISTWKELLAQGDYNIKTILRNILQSNMSENFYDIAIILSARWNEILDNETKGMDIADSKAIFRKDLLILLNKIQNE